MITLTIDDLAAVLHKSKKTIYEDIRRNPASIPPRVIIPGSSRLLWRKETVDKWLEEHEEKPVGRKRKAA